MLRKRLLSLLVTGAIGALPALALADDTDIYIEPNVAEDEQPLVMFSLDYRPNLMGSAAAAGTDTFFTNAPHNLGTLVTQLKTINGNNSLNYFDQLFLSLVAVLKGIPVPVKIGLMMAHNVDGNKTGYQGENPSNANKVSNGGAILLGFRSTNSASTIDKFIEKMIAVKKMNTSSSAADHTYQGAELFFEFFRYLTGQKVYSGHNGWFDYESGNDKDGNTNMRCSHTSSDLRPACWDSTIEDADPTTAVVDAIPVNNPASSPPSYISPFSTNGACAKIFTVNFLFQVSQQDNDANNSSDAGAATTAGGLGFTPSNSRALNDVLAFLRDTDLAEDTGLDADTTGEAFGPAGSQPEVDGVQNVKSFFVSNNSNTTTNGYAAAGGTDSVVLLGGNPQDMIDALTNVFNQIISVSTTFVAASVPVNVFNRAEIVDNVYFALFQAQTEARWNGNLKKLKLATVDVTDADGNPAGQRFEIVDASSPAKPAIGGGDGRIINDALTFWTDNSGTKLDAGDSNGDGVVDAKDGADADTFADNVSDVTGLVTFPTPATGSAANPENYVSNADGRHIPRGGAGQKIPGFASGSGGPKDNNAASGARQVYYLTSDATAASLTGINAGSPTNELKVQLGSPLVAGAPTMTDAEASKLLRYARGQDAGDVDQDCGTNTDPVAACRTEGRYWQMGDPLHARPLPINYGALTGFSTTNPAIYIAMAGNDGLLRMIRNTNSDGTQSGQEVWSFMPPEGMAVQKRLLENTQPAGESPHPYSVDGEATALIIDQDGDGNVECVSTCNGAADDDRVVLYFGLRRGGSSYYAIDVTEPETPKFLWRIRPGFLTTATTGEDASSNYAELGQTFSRPRIARLGLGAVSGSDKTTRVRLAVMFGGGYDGGYTLSGTSTARIGNDIDGVMADDSVGKAIFAVRANDGSLIWKGVSGSASDTATIDYNDQLKDSIPSNLTVLDTNADGLHDRVYVGDTGGNIWRVDMGADNDGVEFPTQAQTTDDWKMTRLACLGRHGATSAGGCDNAASAVVLNDRRFFHEPDVVQSFDGSGRFDAVLIGSGDRENPLDQGGPLIDSDGDGQVDDPSKIDVDNYFYMIKDRNVETSGALTDSTRNHFSLTDVTSCIRDACTVGAEGWRMHLDNGPNGEKALSAPVTIDNNVFFTTYLPKPPASACGASEGSGFLYALELANAAPARDYQAGDGTPLPDGRGTTDNDRDKELDTPGIPAQVVYLGVPGGGDDDQQCKVNILAGAQIEEAPGCPRFRTFWQRLGQ